MTTETQFLQAIRENPFDDSIRLVFADWLEEQGDWRADYLRLACMLSSDFHSTYQQIEIRTQLCELGDLLTESWERSVCRPHAVILEEVKTHKIFAVRSILYTLGFDLYHSAMLVGVRISNRSAKRGLPKVIAQGLTAEAAARVVTEFQNQYYYDGAVVNIYSG